MSLQPIKIWGQQGPNPPKVTMICEELGLPYTHVPIQFSEVKSPEYLAVNPNGRVPAIHDPNTDLTIWESGAIIEYLVEKYDKEHKISFAPGSPESYLAKQWLFFQVSGQGPYYGQAIVFQRYHPEKVPSAVERYVNEIKRVTGVLEGHLKKQKEQGGGEGPWLVGNRYSFADLAFVPWQTIISLAVKDEGFDAEEYPVVKEWLGNMNKREAVRKVMEPAMAAMAARQ
ncbi:glutathione S-transferase [Trematosphaeria pertusa]|uniref:glutathione transferase n=1 Tax=Trematosphaeria pertusa TaxID=390896 RepID=A0A6A6J424_9PLEO|nr:glutathione S-transferase [Trematosphaeria pertusa]KAF2257449.1 glutathione S-transferase [Trematosphaeria pertusa]